jgi:hypothetical protein
LDYNKWKNGFKSKIDMFDWIIKSKYFNIECFNPHNFNHKFRINMKCRPNFRLFVEYIYNIKLESKESITYIVEDYIKIFNKENDKKRINRKIYINRLHREKFNGMIFLQYTDAKNINIYKEDFKNNISLSQDFNEWLEKNNLEFINNQIKEFILKNQISNH